MKKVYLYPLTARTENAVINPYMGNLKDSLNRHFEVLNASKPSSIGIFDVIKYLRKMDVIYFNWSEEVPQLHRGRIQGIFLLLLLQYLKLSPIVIVWTLHNKESHFTGHKWLKKRLYSQMLKKSDLIITHASDGLNLIPKGKSATFQHHPVGEPLPPPVREKECQFDLIIWGTIAPYKGITSFLNYLEEEGSLHKYKILLAGKVTSPSLANELRVFGNKYSNLILMDGYVEESKLIDLIHDSKITLFTYQSDTVLSSGALMDSLSYGATIVGPDVGAFNDLHKLGLIETYSDFHSLMEVIDRLLTSPEENLSKQKMTDSFMADNSWDQFSTTILNLIEQKSNQ